MKMPREIAEMLKSAMDENNGLVVIKTCMASEAEKKEMAELDKLKDQIKMLMSEMNARNEVFWGNVRKDHKLYGVDHLHYNDETHEIEIMGDPKKDRPIVRSPIQALDL